MANLETSFAEELITRPERDLNDRAEFCQLLCGIVLDISDALNRDAEVYLNTYQRIWIPQSKQLAA